MATPVLIPSVLPEEDPEWVWHKKAGKHLNREQQEEFMKWQHDHKLKLLKRTATGVGSDVLYNIFKECHDIKKHMLVASNCGGWNQLFLDGYPGNPFSVWTKYVDDKKHEASLCEFMQQYDIDPFVSPMGESNYRKTYVIKFFTAKFGIMTCFDVHKQFGTTIIPIDPGIIMHYEQPKQLKRSWNLAQMSACNGEESWEELDQFRIPYNKSQTYLKQYGNDLDILAA